MLLIFEIAHLNFTQHYTDSGEEIQYTNIIFNHSNLISLFSCLAVKKNSLRLGQHHEQLQLVELFFVQSKS